VKVGVKCFPWRYCRRQRGSESNKAKEGMLPRPASERKRSCSMSGEGTCKATQTPRPSSRALREGVRAAGLVVSPLGIEWLSKQILVRKKFSGSISQILRAFLKFRLVYSICNLHRWNILQIRWSNRQLITLPFNGALFFDCPTASVLLGFLIF